MDQQPQNMIVVDQQNAKQFPPAARAGRKQMLMSPSLDEPPFEYKREVKIQKGENERFGLCLCTIDSKIYVLHVCQKWKVGKLKRGIPTPALRSGLMWGDQITRVNDVSVSEWDPLDLEVALDCRKRVSLEYLETPLHRKTPVRSGIDRLGLSYKNGVIVGVAPGSPASDAGLCVGEAIVEVDGISLLGCSDWAILRTAEEARFWSSTPTITFVTMPAREARLFALALRELAATVKALKLSRAESTSQTSVDVAEHKKDDNISTSSAKMHPCKPWYLRPKSLFRKLLSFP